MNIGIQTMHAHVDRRIKRIDNNPRRAAALKAIRRAMDAGQRPAPLTAIGDGVRCRTTGLWSLGGRWVTASEYGDLTGIDG